MDRRYERPDDWEESFKKWKAERQNKLKEHLEVIESPVMNEKVIPKEKPFEEKARPEFSTRIRPGYKLKITLLLLLALIIVLLEYFALKFEGSNTSFLVFTVSLFIVSLTFFVILFVYKVYEKSTSLISPLLALAISYALISVNLLLSPKIYSLDWAFLGFLVIAVIFYDFKIDSRFLILPALLLLGYIPFLLIGAQKEIAETMAVYVYYFLVVGVALQILEHYKQTKNSVDFSLFIEKPLAEQKIIYALSIWGIVVIAMILFNRFYPIELLKWSSVYIFFVLLVFYGISASQERKQHMPEPAQR